MSNTGSEQGIPLSPLLITPGDPAGIGPDLCIGLAADPPVQHFVVIADPGLLTQRAKLLGESGLRLREWQSGETAISEEGLLHILPVPLGVPVQAGRPASGSGVYTLACLQQAVDLCQRREAAGLVTGPISKQVIATTQPDFTGHTEWLARATGAEHSVMMLATDRIRVALVTTHLPLREVPVSVTKQAIIDTGSVLYQELQSRFGIPAPRILVAGLNPHAGEGGLLGDEEQQIIAPALAELAARGMPMTGPLPGDTLFTPGNMARADAFLAMYHDQGLAVVKHAGFGSVVNVTLGLPIVRTSVDHGTAYDLAGTGRASDSSLRLALRWAADLAAGRSP